MAKAANQADDLKQLFQATSRMVPVEKINPAPYNPREVLKPGDEEYAAIKASLTEFGLADPLVWNEVTGNLVGGHQRFTILVEEFKAKSISCSVVHIEDIKREMSLNLALNKIRGRQDYLKLKAVFTELKSEGALLNATGYAPLEVQQTLLWEPKTSDSGIIGRSPDERLPTYMEGAIRQIVLYYKAEDYKKKIDQFEGIATEQEFEDNTSVVDFLFEFYETHRSQETAD